MTHRPISVITRTLGRDCLADAAASVAAQTLRPLEWVVVDAAGSGLVPPPAGDVPVHVVSTGARMLRSPAGNAAFDSARGERFLVLDDDDLILPGHLEHLSAALDAAPGARAAYSDWEEEVAPGERRGGHAPPYSHLLLTRRNLFPPHAVLFDAELTRIDGCRYDVGLDFFDDWDLWLSIARRTRFVHSPRCTAVYRTGLSRSGVHDRGSAHVDPRLESDLAAVRARYRDDRERLEREQRERKEAAILATTRGDLAAGARLWSEAHLADPLDVAPVVAYAELAVRAGDLAAARSVLEDAVARMPGARGLRRRLGEVRAAMGEPAGAP
ncbi:hypothetical protein BURK1_00948 [Burkholderiales bacterium]|nr:hypothetical protein BURK1_00948 [Burkholderiales bacterium]